MEARYHGQHLVVPTRFLSIEIVLNIAKNGQVPDLEIWKKDLSIWYG